MLSRTNASKRSRAALGVAAVLVLVGCSHDSLGSLGPGSTLDTFLEGELELTPSELLITDASTATFGVRLVQPNGSVVTNLGTGTALEWSSSAPGIASVGSSGAVTAKQPGVAEVSVRLGDRVARAPVVVLPLPSDMRPMFDGEMTGTAGASLPDSVAVRVIDRGGLPVSGVEVTFNVELGSGSVSPATAVTDGAGVARSKWRLGDSAGDNAVRASAPGLQDLWLRARGEGSEIDHFLELVGGNSQIGTVDETLGQKLAVRVVDGSGAPVANVPVEWVFDDGTVAGEGTTGAVTTDGAGVARIDWRLGASAGTNEARARLASGVEKWFKAEAKGGGVAAIFVTPASSSLGIGDQVTLTYRAEDRFGNTVPVHNLRWKSSDKTVASVAQSGQAQGLTVGQATVTASSGKIKGTSAVTVNAAGASAIAIESGNGQTSTVGTALPAQLAAKVTDAGGAPVSGVIVSWSVVQGGGSLSVSSSTTDGSGIARVTLTTGLQAGVNQVSAATGALPAVTFTATGVAGAASSVSVTPISTSLEAGSTKQLQASAVDAHGNSVPGITFQWSSADAAVATVDSHGLVTGVSEGTTSVSAASGSLVATATVTVTATATQVVLDTSTDTINAIGYSVRLTARAFTAEGTEIPNTPITWSSLTPSTASVDQLGRVFSQGVGTALITASLACCTSDTATIDSRQVLANVNLSPGTASLDVGESLQMQMMALDSNGVVVNGVNVGWTSESPAIALVSASGVVSADAPGSAVITVDVTPTANDPDPSTRLRSSTVLVTDPPTPDVAVAELPRQYVNTAVPSTTRDVHVAAGGDLQAAIDAAQRGDRILLAPGGVYGAVLLPPKSGSGWIVIQTDVALPSGRMTPSAAASLNLAALEDGTANLPVVRALGDVSYYRIQGVEIRASSSASVLSEMVKIDTDRSISSGIVQPSHIVLDRVIVKGNPPALQLKRCVALNGQNVAVVNSSLIGCSKLGQDSQAILILDGLGPTAIVNNYLQAGSEIVMSGGGDPHIAGVVPSDIEIRGNYFHRPLSWKNAGIGVIKNLLEFKNAQRVLVENNVMEGNWSDGQSGWAIVIKSTNQDGGCTWCTSDDITIRWNLVDDSENGLRIIWGNSTGAPHGATERIVVENNVFARLGSNGNNPGWGTPLRLLQMPSDVSIMNNTLENFGGNHFLIADGVGGSGANVSVMDNVGWSGLYGIWQGDGSSIPASSWTGNAVIGGVGGYCNLNQCPSSAQMQTVVIAGVSYTLPVVPGKGADLSQLAQRLQSVR